MADAEPPVPAGSATPPLPAPERESVKLYLDYLKIEMNIMGILSAFCMLTAGLVLEKTIGGDKPGEGLGALWRDGCLFVVLGSIAIFASGAYFYLQRSLLAYYYGQITLSIPTPEIPRSSTRKLLEESDEWVAWERYHVGILLSMMAFVQYLLALLATKLPCLRNPIGSWVASVLAMIVCLIFMTRWRKKIMSGKWE